MSGADGATAELTAALNRSTADRLRREHHRYCSGERELRRATPLAAAQRAQPGGRRDAKPRTCMTRTMRSLRPACAQPPAHQAAHLRLRGRCAGKVDLITRLRGRRIDLVGAWPVGVSSGAEGDGCPAPPMRNTCAPSHPLPSATSAATSAPIPAACWRHGRPVPCRSCAVDKMASVSNGLSERKSSTRRQCRRGQLLRCGERLGSMAP